MFFVVVVMCMLFPLFSLYSCLIKIKKQNVGFSFFFLYAIYFIKKFQISFYLSLFQFYKITFLLLFQTHTHTHSYIDILEILFICNSFICCFIFLFVVVARLILYLLSIYLLLGFRWGLFRCFFFPKYVYTQRERNRYTF